MPKNLLSKPFLTVLLLTYVFLVNIVITNCKPLEEKMENIQTLQTDTTHFIEKIIKALDQELEKPENDNIEKMDFLPKFLDKQPLENVFLTFNTLLDLLAQRDNGSFSGLCDLVNENKSTYECKEKIIHALQGYFLSLEAASKESGPSFNEENIQKMTSSLHSLSSRLRVLADDKSPVKKEDVESSEGVKVAQQGAASTGAIFIVVLILVGLMAYGVVWIIKKKKKTWGKKTNVEKQRFIPRLQISMEAPFEESKNRLNGILGRKKDPTSKSIHTNGQNIFTPSHKTQQGLNLEDNHQSSIINDNIFTNIDNSPRSQDDEKESPSAKQTPKDIGFNIEFSMLEQNSKIHSARDLKND